MEWEKHHVLPHEKSPRITRDELLHKHHFITGYQKALLHSLLEKNQITREQYEQYIGKVSVYGPL